MYALAPAIGADLAVVAALGLAAGLGGRRDSSRPWLLASRWARQRAHVPHAPEQPSTSGATAHDQRRHPRLQRRRQPGRAPRRARRGVRGTGRRSRSSSCSSTTAAGTARGPSVAELARRDPRVSAIRFRRNFGKAVGAHGRVPGRAGRSRVHARRRPPGRSRPRSPSSSTGSIEGLDVVSGWKKTRHDPWHKVYPSRVFNRMVSRLTGCHLARPQLRVQGLSTPTCSTRSASTASCTGSCPPWPTPGASASARSKSTIGPGGTAYSKYGFARFLKGFLDLLTVRFLTRFRHRPLHVLGGTGLVLLGLGLLGMMLPGGASGSPASGCPTTGRSATGRCSSIRSPSWWWACSFSAWEPSPSWSTAYVIRSTDMYSIAETADATRDRPPLTPDRRLTRQPPSS